MPRASWRCLDAPGAVPTWITVTVTARPIVPPSFPLPAELAVGALLLPREVQGEVGLYDDSAATLVKELRVAGATADHLHPADSREWIGEKHVPIIVADFFVALGAHAGWSALEALLRRGKTTDHVRVRVARYRRTPSETTSECFELEGPKDGVADALEVLESQRSEEPDGGPQA